MSDLIIAIVGLIGAIIGAIVGVLISYLLGKNFSIEQLKVLKKQSEALSQIAEKQGKQIDFLKSQLEQQDLAVRKWGGIQERALEQNKKEFEWQQTKDILSSLWKIYNKNNKLD